MNNSQENSFLFFKIIMLFKNTTLFFNIWMSIAMICILLSEEIPLIIAEIAIYMIVWVLLKIFKDSL